MRGSHFYLALFWAEALATQSADLELQAIFQPLAEALTSHQAAMQDEFVRVQGQPMDIGGYYHPDPAKVIAAMRPSPTFNTILENFAATIGN